jgi:hypothetical protein
VFACVFVLVPGAASSAPPADKGVICIAPFRMDDDIRARYSPNMSTTQAPSPDTVFTFIVDKRLKATVKNLEMGKITGVPVDRKVKVEVRAGKEGFETFWLHLGKKPDQRVCLWLYPGYWHWIDNGWDPKLGCKCEVDG